MKLVGVLNIQNNFNINYTLHVLKMHHHNKINNKLYWIYFNQ